ncbi:MAG: hypothetical protein A2268_02495 [Candidatus Raymondbacteria bacterium RifOxyA12_full_50_37]|uniref:Response regulatory domain-containing protein n=1 Tax=Candidatus Raymondbacteria bacterium RIFOXYD12_FULL_49_13 TaxID=1817890 RepID=A0A1F7FEM4_UNCRA|nr:MAG: hypothetical protein A2268_02495 [Candidatus Raymondbacteria bacterium RifOxyA12_full_50_37]OGJ89130.1 MAG: hypothetical protein A2248_11270 [Candidatus Raymondbacteria bacterium RIFOXYA2_FULL_49_16]OGJ96612.1 MAG: hypothetical protein A2453_06385 [Candidatus Raymondbacteria bacterium RIFOXYC2_FULL_50_21]OGK01766.1 MAG: hypothetical protein A2350_04735 [Candidatus Raymondbacteria bacterium RifOxyB12_full_50_8]OGK04713.1 MAG: hypothetical protein A2487_16740 [Candidatus Raymondbacteria b
MTVGISGGLRRFHQTRALSASSGALSSIKDWVKALKFSFVEVGPSLEVDYMLFSATPKGEGGKNVEWNCSKVKGAKPDAEATNIFDEKGRNIKAVISDVVLPDGTGISFYENHVEPRRFNTPVVFVSGYADDRSEYAKIRKKGYGFLPKPYTMSALLSTLHAALHLSSRTEGLEGDTI